MFCACEWKFVAKFLKITYKIGFQDAWDADFSFYPFYFPLNG